MICITVPPEFPAMQEAFAELTDLTEVARDALTDHVRNITQMYHTLKGATS